jgi:hypothetical protein
VISKHRDKDAAGSLGRKMVLFLYKKEANLDVEE